MSNVIYVRSYQRKKAGPTAEFVRKTEELLPYDLGDLLIGALETELPKLLPDLSREDIARIEETW
jgi:hypothetical protein